MKKTILLFVILLCNAMLAAAGPVTETRLTLSPALLHFDYTEFSTTDEVLDRELGWLPGLAFRLSHAITPDWSVDAYTSYYSGTVDYDGQTQSGIPHSTTTGTDLFRFGGQVNTAIYKKTHLYVGAQLHQWNRDIKDTNTVSGIDETYRWLEYSIGLNSDIFIDQHNVFNVDIAYLLTRNGTLDVDLSRVDLGSTTLNLGDGTGARLNLNWKRISTNNIHYGISLFAEGWDFGRSNSKLTTGGSPNVLVTEPKSETRNTGIQFNIEYHF
ncbi:MAG: hypothetical protein IMF14_01760 [Proteobacteria bacterium]|nr:hypothetical protein [Pseudomonadota bacterium]